MSKVIAPGGRVEHTERRRAFEWLDCPGAGFSFLCDEHGNILMGDLAPEALDSVLTCFTDERVADRGIEVYSHSYREGPTVECDCGRHVHCDDSWANGCECGREYNSSGQQLAPRSQWGAEWVTQPEEDYGLY